MQAVRTVVAGSFGKVGWLVPLMLVWIGWRTLRDPETNGPAGRQVVGWVALAFGVLGVVHIAAGNPQPVAGDASDLQSGGGAVGYVVSSLLLDLLRTPYVVVPLLLLLSAFGILVITATPVYQVPVKLRAFRDRLLGRTPAGEDESDLPTQPLRSRSGPLDDIDPDMGDPAYDSPVLSDRELRKRKRGLGRLSEGDRRRPAPPRRSTTARRRHLHRPGAAAARARSRSAWSSSSSPATSSTACPPTRC